MLIQIVDTTFEPYVILQKYQQQLLKGQHGACCVFIGTMRDFNEGACVRQLFLEHYPEMTQNYLTQLVAKAQSQWKLLDCLLIHRVGDILPGDSIVLIATWANHRGDAFDANRYLIEELKSQVPFWKKEYLNDGTSRWVEHNTSGYSQNE